MNRRQGHVIVSLLAVVAVVLAVLLGYLLGSGADREADTATNPTASSSSSSSSSAPTPASTSSQAVSEDPPTSDAQPAAPPAPVDLPAPPVETEQAQPTFVECLFGTPGPARFSDGSTRNHPPCGETPEARQSRDAEQNCNSAEWRRQMEAQGDRFCGSSAWAEGFFD